MSALRGGIFRTAVALTLLASQAAAGHPYVACIDGTPCAHTASAAEAASRACCHPAPCEQGRPEPGKTCVVLTTPGVDALKFARSAVPPLQLSLPDAPLLAALQMPPAATARSGRVSDELPPPLPPPRGAAGPRAPPPALSGFPRFRHA